MASVDLHKLPKPGYFASHLIAVWELLACVVCVCVLFQGTLLAGEKSKGKPKGRHAFYGKVEREATKKPLVLESHGSFWSFGGREIEAEIKPVSMGSFGEVFLARPGRRAMGETHGQRVSSVSIISMAVGFLGLGFSGPFQ